MTFVLRGANVLDESGGFDGPLDIVVRDGTVEAIEANAAADGATDYDFSGLFVMPGVFDCHEHVAMSSLDGMESLRTPITRWALEAAANAKRVLEAGVTFMRDPGGADPGIRDSVAAGHVPGPRMQVAIVLIAQTGGHIDGYLPGPGIEITSSYFIPDYPGRPPYLVDSPDRMREVVRSVLRAGADWIKLCTTGGVMSPTDEPHIPELTYEEIAVATFEAARKGKYVMTHANAGEGIDNAVKAGVRSVEHGLWLSEEQATTMAASNCWLVPTLAIQYEVIALAEQGLIPEYSARKALELKPILGEALRVARAAGVKIALGTDYISRDQHGKNLIELVHMREAGLSPEECLLAATISGAELCGVEETYGRIAPGYVFDAIVLDDDPGDLSIFRQPDAVRGVFKGGDAVVRHERLA